jgi:hypothetical protein
LGELHVSLLKSIIKDIEDVARTPPVALGVNLGGGHPLSRGRMRFLTMLVLALTSDISVALELLGPV